MDRFVTEHLATDGDPDGAVTMGYYTRGDLPYYYALADAFTLCDGYHCSVIGPSYPNQVYAISATLDPAGLRGGPVVGDVKAGSLSWTTMPAQLEARGISWKVYTSPDDYAPEAIGDPPFHFFAQYFSNPALGQKAFGNAYPAQLQQDVRGQGERQCGQHQHEQHAAGDQLHDEQRERHPEHAGPQPVPADGLPEPEDPPPDLLDVVGEPVRVLCARNRGPRVELDPAEPAGMHLERHVEVLDDQAGADHVDVGQGRRPIHAGEPRDDGDRVRPPGGLAELHQQLHDQVQALPVGQQEPPEAGR